MRMVLQLWGVVIGSFALIACDPARPVDLSVDAFAQPPIAHLDAGMQADTEAPPKSTLALGDCAEDNPLSIAPMELSTAYCLINRFPVHASADFVFDAHQGYLLTARRASDELLVERWQVPGQGQVAVWAAQVAGNPLASGATVGPAFEHAKQGNEMLTGAVIPLGEDAVSTLIRWHRPGQPLEFSVEGVSHAAFLGEDTVLLPAKRLSNGDEGGLFALRPGREPFLVLPVAHGSLRRVLVGQKIVVLMFYPLGFDKGAQVWAMSKKKLIAAISSGIALEPHDTCDLGFEGVFDVALTGNSLYFTQYVDTVYGPKFGWLMKSKISMFADEPSAGDLRTVIARNESPLTITNLKTEGSVVLFRLEGGEGAPEIAAIKQR